MSEGLSIRPVKVHETDVLLALSRKTFFDAFYHLNQPGDMELYAGYAFKMEKLKAELENPDSYFFFAEVDTTPVGYLKLNSGTAQTDMHNLNALEIERVYVDASYQGRQIGARLLQFAMAQAREWQCNQI